MKNPLIHQNAISRATPETENQLAAYADWMRSSVPRSERYQTLLAGFTALAAGYLDDCGLPVLGTYVSFMSGNATTAAVEIGQAHFALALFPVIAMAAFVAGSVVARAVMLVLALVSKPGRLPAEALTINQPTGG